MKTPAEAAKAWYNKAKTEHDCFDRFVYQWFAFNILYSPYFDDNERRAIKNYIHDNWRSIVHLEDLLDSEQVNYFKQRIIRNCRLDSSNDTAEYAARLKSERNSLKYRLIALMMILYQVRCNLFHGNKLFTSESDQEVVDNAASVMQEVLSNWV